MDFDELRRIGGARLDHRGRTILVAPSDALRPVSAGLPTRAAWELRWAGDPGPLIGYIDAISSGLAYAFDPMAWDHGVLGSEVRTLEEAVRELLRP